MTLAPTSPAAVRPRALRLESLEVLRGLAAVLVVLFHVEGIAIQQAGVRPFGGWFGAGRTGVDLFFVLSGFIIAYVHRADVGRPPALKQYVFNRLSRIYPSVWIVSALAVGVYAAGFGGAGKADKLAPSHLIASVLLIPQRAFPLVNVTWTLVYEIFFYGLFALCILRRRLGVTTILAWQAAVLGLALSGTVLAGGVWTLYFQPFCAEFGIGIACALVVERLARTRASDAVLRASLVAGAVAFVGGLAFGARRPEAVTPLRALAMYGVTSAAMVIGAATLELRGRLARPAPLLVVLGSASYSVYLVHYSVISLLAVAVVRTRLVPVDTPVAILLAACGVGAGLAFDRWIDRPIHRALRRAWRRTRSRDDGAAAPGGWDGGMLLRAR